MKTFLGALLSAFLFVSPALATDYYVDDAGSGSACTEASPCDEIADVNLLTLGANDNVYFDCGATFNDARLDPSGSGTSGNPITIRSGEVSSSGADCAGNDATIDGASFLNAITLTNEDYYTFSDLIVQGSTGGAGADIFNVDTVTGLTLTDMTIGGGQTATGKRCLDIHDAPSLTINNLTITGGCKTEGFIIDATADDVGNTSGTINTASITDSGEDTSGDLFAIDSQNTGSITINDMTLDEVVANPGAENCVDIKGGTHTFNRLTTVDCGSAAIVIHNPDNIASPANVTFNDSDLANSNQSVLNCDDDATCTLNRTKIYGGASTNRLIGCSPGGDGFTSTGGQLTMNASSVEVESGKGTAEAFEVHGSCDLVFDNSTVIMRNGAGLGLRIFHQRSTTDGTLTIRNSIIAGDSVDLVDEDAGAAAVLTFSDNLWDGDAAPTVIFDLEGEGNLDSDDIGATAPVNNDTYGDPLFVSEDESSNLYLMLNLGSPGIGLGDAANLYATPATDIHGRRFNGTTPNAGATSQAIQIKSGDRGKPIKTAMVCECAVDEIKNSRFILACECIQ